MNLRLDRLLAGLVDAPPVSVSGLRLDGRSIESGEAFVAVRGSTAHGLAFVGQAIERGARAVLWDPDEAATPRLPPGIVAVAVPSLRARLGLIADRAHGSPSARLSIAGVTGTNGKTTCAWLLAAAGSRLGPRSAYIGTLGFGFPPRVEDGALTTPDVLSVHRLLAEAEAAGAARVAIEVSSHALEQERLSSVRMEVAAFTNLTRDHLDYHGSMAAYAAAKRRIFAQPGVAHAVINVGDPAGREFAGALPSGVELTAVSVGQPCSVDAARWVRVELAAATPEGLELVMRGPFGSRRLCSPLVGAFNAENLGIVLGMLLAWGHDAEEALGALASIAAPPGRMEGFRGAGGVLAIVDYAHTPDALTKLLEAARHHARGRLRVVFGCGGERDPGKRAPMGGIAERLADDVIITDDNPRGENPDAIVEMILAGMAAPERARVIRDRGAAIATALAESAAGDVVVVAGKGHERHQLVGEQRRPFSDRERVAALAGGAV